MSCTKISFTGLVTSIALLLSFSSWATDVPKPKYSADIPEFLLTPDKLETVK